uniref:Uncharacterized protein n=1 Tax=Rhizophora mucronata TaxID=61149 RepID=A0A2P2P246_RHIMU
MQFTGKCSHIHCIVDNTETTITKLSIHFPHSCPHIYSASSAIFNKCLNLTL